MDYFKDVWPIILSNIEPVDIFQSHIYVVSKQLKDISYNIWKDHIKTTYNYFIIPKKYRLRFKRTNMKKRINYLKQEGIFPWWLRYGDFIICIFDGSNTRSNSLESNKTYIYKDPNIEAAHVSKYSSDYRTMLCGIDVFKLPTINFYADHYDIIPLSLCDYAAGGVFLWYTSAGTLNEQICLYKYRAKTPKQIYVITRNNGYVTAVRPLKYMINHVGLKNLDMSIIDINNTFVDVLEFR
jgi:hypothetical protein